MTNRPRTSPSLHLTPIVLCLTIFVCDLVAPLGYAIWIAYVLPICFVSRRDGRGRIVVVVGVSSLLIIAAFAVGFGMGEQKVDAGIVRRDVLNRSVGLVSLWLLTARRSALRESASTPAIEQEHAQRHHDRMSELECCNALLLQEIEQRQRIEGEFIEARAELETKVQAGTQRLHEVNATLEKSIEERQLAEETRKENDERLRLAMEAAKVGTWDWDIAADRIVCSDNLCTWLGLPSDTAASYEMFLRVVHPDERDHVATAVAAALEKGTLYSVHFRVVGSEGVTHWIHSRGNVFQDTGGRPVRMIGVATDITARKQADGALWEALELETVILSSVPVVTYVTDATDRLVTRWISKNVQTVSGYPPQRFLSEYSFWIDRIHPDDRDRVLDGMQELHHKKTCTSEYRWLHQDGSYHWFFDHISVKHGVQGAPQAFIGVWLDVTDRKQAEHALHRVLEERERLSQELHDGVIQTLYALGLSVEESQRLIREDAAKAVSLLDKTVATINLTISDLRRYIHGSEPDVMTVAVFKTELSSLIALIEAFHARVTLQLSDEGIDRLTPAQIEHVYFIVKEALSNAVRHSNGSDILLSIATRSSGVRIAILDNGSGFNVEIVPLGHGLRNMQNRARKMGAHFSLISAPKKGTLIVVKIPKEAHDGRVAGQTDSVASGRRS